MHTLPDRSHPQSLLPGRSLSIRVASTWLALSALTTSCLSPATALVVIVDSDAIDRRATAIRVSARMDGSSNNGQEVLHRFTTTMDGGALWLPLSFTLVPQSNGPRDVSVQFTIEVDIEGSATAPGVQLRRIARGTFIPGRTLYARAFLDSSCATPAGGCPAGTPGECTVSRVCEARGLTCGQRGMCTSLELTFADDADAAQANQRDRTLDTPAVDIPSPRADVPSDIPTDVPSCVGSTTFCTGRCVDRQTDINHCGACENACPSPMGGSAVCSSGMCSATCPMGTHLCGMQCAADNDPTRCGGACMACPGIANGAATCNGGVCGVACNAGLTLCGGACVDTSRDMAHCGGCGQRCPGSMANVASATCTGGRCVLTCNARTADCNGNGADGCETPLTSNANCGSCGNACTGVYGGCQFSLSSPPKCCKGALPGGTPWPSCGGMCSGGEVCGENPGFQSFCCRN